MEGSRSAPSEASHRTHEEDDRQSMVSYSSGTTVQRSASSLQNLAPNRMVSSVPSRYTLSRASRASSRRSSGTTGKFSPHACLLALNRYAASRLQRLEEILERERSKV